MKNSVSNNKGRNLKFFFKPFSNTVLLLILLTSCTSLPGRKALPSDTHPVPVSWFDADTTHCLFNTAIDLMKKHFSGITIVK
ncbi:MAG TPA: hypothetical protein VHI78_04960, partial [Bacteroidales bacterium]|nr:hypothetical protein [Bacteroidales bacterium]